MFAFSGCIRVLWKCGTWGDPGVSNYGVLR